MALPLPKVVYDVGPGGGIVTSMRGGNALTQSSLENQIKQAEAQYAPYNAYANAASKIAYSNMLPYQIQATVMSNPMLWMALKDNPQAMKEMMSNFANSVPKGNEVFGNVDIPKPTMGNAGNSLLGMFMNAIGKNAPSPNQLNSMPNDQASGNPMAPMTTQPSPGGSRLVPATQGGLAGVAGKMTAPYSAEAQKPGTTFYDEGSGSTVSSPTSDLRTDLQKSINAALRVEPQLKALSDAASPFLTAGGLAEMNFERVKNFFKLGKEGKLPSQYAKFKSLIQSAPEALVKAYGLRPTNETIERMQKVIEPYYGETKDDYKLRILNTLQSIKDEQIGVSKEQLSQGFTVGETKPTQERNKVVWKVFDPQGKLVATGPEEAVNNFLKDHKGYYREK